jgi:hypothetical protein
LTEFWDRAYFGLTKGISVMPVSPFVFKFHEWRYNESFDLRREEPMRTLRLGMGQINPTVGDLEGNTHKIIQYIHDA